MAKEKKEETTKEKVNRIEEKIDDVIENTEKVSLTNQEKIENIILDLLEKEQNRNTEEAITYLQEAVKKLNKNDFPEEEVKED